MAISSPSPKYVQTSRLGSWTFQKGDEDVIRKIFIVEINADLRRNLENLETYKNEEVDFAVETFFLSEEFKKKKGNYRSMNF